MDRKNRKEGQIKSRNRCKWKNVWKL